MSKLNSLTITNENTQVLITFLSGDDLIEFSDPGVQNEFLQKVLSKISGDTNLVLFDMTNLPRINSAMLGVLVQMQKEVHGNNIPVQVKGANSTVRKVMELTRLQHFLIDE